MKKIITVLFFAGFLTTVSFAQSGHRQQYNTQSSTRGYGSQQYSGNSRGQYSQNSYKNEGDYNFNGGNNRYNENDYGYNNARDTRERYMREGRYDYNRHNHRRFEDHYYREGHRNW